MRGACARTSPLRCLIPSPPPPPSPPPFTGRSGKHRTGAVIGCLRMLQRWTLAAACDEYTRYTFHKQRFVDKQFIERFDPRILAQYITPRELLAPWLPSDYTVGCSALEAAIRQGLLLPEHREVGLSVAAELEHPEEPYFAAARPPHQAATLTPPAASGAAGAEPCEGHKGADAGGAKKGAEAGGGGGCPPSSPTFPSASTAPQCAPPADPASTGEGGGGSHPPPSPLGGGGGTGFPPCVCLSPLGRSLRTPQLVVPLKGGLLGLVFTKAQVLGAGAACAEEGEGQWGGGMGHIPCHEPGASPCVRCPTCSQEQKVHGL
jgi:hypothetical protein